MQLTADTRPVCANVRIISFSGGNDRWPAKSANCRMANKCGEYHRALQILKTTAWSNSNGNLSFYLMEPHVRCLSFCDVKIIPGEIEYRREDLNPSSSLPRVWRTATWRSSERRSKQTKDWTFVACIIEYAYAEQQQSFKELLTILAMALFVFGVMHVLIQVMENIPISISVAAISGCIIALYVVGIHLT